MVQSKKTHTIQKDEVEIGPLQLQLMLGSAGQENFKDTIHSIFCLCEAEHKHLVNYKSYINTLNDVILNGHCSSCKAIAVRYIETGEQKGIHIIADKIRKLNQK